MSIPLTSTAFEAGQTIPAKYTSDGQDVSPALAWSNLPEGTQELVLICDDPDAPRAEPWVHWVIYGLSPDLEALPEGIPQEQTLSEPVEALQGENSWKGSYGYRGPAPPPGHGVHHYHFKLYASDARLDLQPGIDKDAALAALQGHILAEGELIGTYQR